MFQKCFICTGTYFWPVFFLFFRVNVTISNDTKPNSLAAKPRTIVKGISKLKPFTLYAFQVEAVVLKNEGAKSDLVFIQTKESGKLRKTNIDSFITTKNTPAAYQNALTFKQLAFFRQR